jgi:hypothetical protein
MSCALDKHGAKWKFGSHVGGSAMKVPVARIVVTWTESPVRRWIGVPLASWREADRALAAMLAFAPDTGAHRTGFHIHWRDDQHFIGRIRLRGDEAGAPGPRPLSTFVRRQLEVAAGRRRPDTLTGDEYLAFLEAQGAEVIARAAHLLDRYDLGDWGSIATP